MAATPSSTAGPERARWPHLVRDFGRITGMTPTRFAARLRSGREVKSVQDPAASA
jgi:hypothetical protein